MSICFRDKAFCEAARNMDCINTSCHRYFGPETQAAAERWWGGPDAPIAFLMMTADECPIAIKPEQPKAKGKGKAKSKKKTSTELVTA